jgi:hypothetical protein
MGTGHGFGGWKEALGGPGLPAEGQPPEEPSALDAIAEFARALFGGSDRRGVPSGGSGGSAFGGAPRRACCSTGRAGKK